MSVRVVAVVISNDQPNYLRNCLQSLEKQSYKTERILVLDSSTNSESQSVLDEFVKRSTKHAVISIEDKATYAELSALAIKQALAGFTEINDVAIWLLHEDSVAEPHALAELVRTLELSPLVGVASPKQLAMDNPKMIVQQGLTVSKTYKPFSIVNDELDQKQHDGMSDVLAVSTNAMLLRANLWVELGGFSLSAPALAQDIEFGIRAHQAGYRVVVVPTARVRHAELSIHGKRDKSWLGGSVKYALAKATNHLRLSQYPLVVAFLFWLALPLVSVYQLFQLMLVKRPDRIWFTLRANFWAFFTFRARLRDRHGLPSRGIKQLFASRAQLKSRARLALEQAEQESNLESYQDGQVRIVSGTPLSFAASGGVWLMMLLAAFSYQYFPLGESASGGFALPLSQSWLQLFSNVGGNYQNIGLGLAAPSDPFNWVLLIIGSITFWNPNVALSWLLLISKSVAFFGAWRVLSLVTHRASLRTVLALSYAFIPAFGLAQSQGNYPAVIFSMVFPWLIFSLARAGRLGHSSSVRSTSQTWSWIAASGLLLFTALACAPSVMFVILVLLIVFSILVRKKILSMMLIPIPWLAICFSYLTYQIINNQHPLGILADPTISFSTSRPEFVRAIIGSDPFFSWCLLGLLVLSALGLLTSTRKIFAIWLLILVAATNLLLLENISFTAGSFGSIFLQPAAEVFDSAAPTVMIIFLGVLAVLAIWFDGLLRSGLRKTFVSLVLVGVLLPLGYLGVTQQVKVSYGEARNLPAIFTAEAASGSQLRMLVISSDGEEGSQGFRAEIIRASGIHLDNVSTAYRLSPANQSANYSGKQELAQLVANLVSANGQKLGKSLKDAGIGYVLIPERPGNGDIQIALNTAAELDQVGMTEFGALWRVKNPKEIEDSSSTLWGVGKVVSLGVLLSYLLLALPTARGRKQRVTNELSELNEENA